MQVVYKTGVTAFRTRRCWLGVVCLSLNFSQCFVKMDEDQWMHDNIMFEKVYMNEENEEEPSVNGETGEEPSVHQNVDCFDAFNTS